MVTDFLSYNLIPLFSALAIPFISRKSKRITEIFANVALLSGLINVGYILFYYVIKMNYSTFTYDALTLAMIFIIYLVALAIVFFSTYYDVEKETNVVSYYSLILISVSAMCSLVMSRDFFTLYIFMEALSVCSFALITSNSKNISVEAAIKYFFLTFPASVLIIFGISLLMLNYGGFGFEIIKFTNINFLSIIAFSLIIIGFLIKSGIAPFHFWTPDVYQGAFSPISAYLAGIITKVGGIYAIIKISIMISNSPIISKISSLLLFTGLLSVILGAVGAIVQRDFKRMLAYSSISQMGYIIMATGTFTPLGIMAAVFHLINHATFKTVLFLNSACVEKATQTTNMDELKGLEHRMPYTSWTSIVALLSTAGVPPLSGFWSKLIIIIALWEKGNVYYATSALIFSIVTLAYFMIMQKKVFFGKLPEKFQDIKEAKFQLLIPVVIISFFIIITGLFFNKIYLYLEKIPI
ncbi:MAG: NADH-quinone oxidoreductase subunit L [Elusimicrobiota bacterium]